MVKFRILQGDFKGREIVGFYNVDHPNPKAVQIAFRELALMAKACNIGNLTDTAQLVGGSLIVRTVFDEPSGRTNVRGFKPLQQTMTNPVAQPSPVAQPQPNPLANPQPTPTPTVQPTEPPVDNDNIPF